MAPKLIPNKGIVKVVGGDRQEKIKVEGREGRMESWNYIYDKVEGEILIIKIF